MPLTRFEYLAALYDDTVCPMPPVVRAAWKSLSRADPLGAYLAGRHHFSAVRSSFSGGILSLPKEIASNVAHFLGSGESYAKLFNLCRASARLSFDIQFDDMQLRARAFWLHDEHRPNPEEMYRLYWMMEKMLAVQGHYRLWMQRGGKLVRGAFNRQLFEGPDVDWKAALNEGGSKFSLPHLRSLTVPPVSETWPTVKCAASSPESPRFDEDAASAVRHALHAVHFPNLSSFFALNLEGEKSIEAVEDFFIRHREVLRTFIAPVDRIEFGLGCYSARFPPIDIRALKCWRYVEYYEVVEGRQWPRFYKAIPADTEFVKVVGFSRNAPEGRLYMLSLAASLTATDILASIRTLVVRNVPGCAALAKVGQLHLRLFSLTVGSCPDEVTACMMSDDDVSSGLGNTDVLAVNKCQQEGGEPQICSQLHHLLTDGFETAETADVVLFRRKSPRQLCPAENRGADLCHALLSRMRGTPSELEVRIRAWHLVDPKCGHHRVLTRIDEEKRKQDLAWFARDCKCDLSWNARTASGDTVCICSTTDTRSPERAAFDLRFANATSDEDGRWEEMTQWLRRTFSGPRSPLDGDSEW